MRAGAFVVVAAPGDFSCLPTPPGSPRTSSADVQNTPVEQTGPPVPADGKRPREVGEEEEEIGIADEHRRVPYFNSIVDLEGQLHVKKVFTWHAKSNNCLMFAFLVARGDMLPRTQKETYAAHHKPDRRTPT